MPGSRRSATALPLLIALLLSRWASAARTRASFDFGWRFHLGPVAAPGGSCNASSFPVPINDVQCLGLSQDTTATDAPSCLRSCCASAPGCSLWQFEGGGVGCWLGSDCSTNLTGAGWIGGRVTPAPPATKCEAGTPCDPSYDDSTWRALAVPHDFVIESGSFDPKFDPSRGALPRNVSWYRKTFSLATSYEGSLVWLLFDGVFRAADIYINGAFVMHHEEGYTSFPAYLHNASVLLNYGAAATNVLAVFVDATAAELWCYEGGGIYRHVWLESASAALSVVPWGLFVPSFVSGAIAGASAMASQTADGALVMPQVDVQTGVGAPAFLGHALFTLRDAGSGDVVVSASTALNVSGWKRVLFGELAFANATNPVLLWNIGLMPPMYEASVQLFALDGAAVDLVSVRIGVRSAIFDARLGFLLNGVKVRLAGVANHVGFGGVGMAVPDRVSEFQVAVLRAAGANAWRTAHNPIAPEALDYMDTYGLLVWEENRFITAGVQPIGGEDVPSADPRLLQDAQDMVLRDRNHPSVVVWSLCNELGCVADSKTGDTLGMQFKIALYGADTTRPVTGNTVQSPYLEDRIVDPFALAMDVQSFSYEYTAYEQYHRTTPWKAVGGGESASCVTDRGYFGPQNGSAGHLGPSDHGLFACVQEAWQAVMAYDFVFGNYIWTGRLSARRRSPCSR